MTGYRRVLTCGEPCAEDFECADCGVDGSVGAASWCATVTGSTACPDTMVVSVSAPAIALRLSCGFEDCIDFTTHPAFDTDITVTKDSAQNCKYSGGSGVIATYPYNRCDGSTLSNEQSVSVSIVVPIVSINPLPSITNPCPSAEICEAYSILVSVSNGSAIVYGFAVSYVGNTDISCSDTVRCYNEYGATSGVISSWVECTAFGDSSYCCDGNPYYQPKNNGANCTNQATGGHSCSLPTGFAIGRPV